MENKGNRMIGNNMNQLTLIEEKFEKYPRGKTFTWKNLYQCDCGNTIALIPAKVMNGHNKSCGCRRSIEGQSKHPLYGKFRGMMTRCYDPNHAGYKHYGGRGITVCQEWRKDPRLFIVWCIQNGWTGAWQYIDRMDNNKGYSPDNCRIVDAKINAQNRRCVRLDVQKVQQILNLFNQGYKKAEIARRFNVGRSLIGFIIAGKIWKNVTRRDSCLTTVQSL